MTATEHKSYFKLTTDSRASYGVSIMIVLDKIDRVIMAPHCVVMEWRSAGLGVTKALFIKFFIL